MGLYYLKTIARDRERAQSVKHSPQKHEGMSSDPNTT